MKNVFLGKKLMQAFNKQKQLTCVKSHILEIKIKVTSEIQIIAKYGIKRLLGAQTMLDAFSSLFPLGRQRQGQQGQ